MASTTSATRTGASPRPATRKTSRITPKVGTALAALEPNRVCCGHAVEHHSAFILVSVSPDPHARWPELCRRCGLRDSDRCRGLPHRHGGTMLFRERGRLGQRLLRRAEEEVEIRGGLIGAG